MSLSSCFPGRVAGRPLRTIEQDGAKFGGKAEVEGWGIPGKKWI